MFFAINHPTRHGEFLLLQVMKPVGFQAFSELHPRTVQPDPGIRLRNLQLAADLHRAHFFELPKHEDFSQAIRQFCNALIEDVDKLLAQKSFTKTKRYSIVPRGNMLNGVVTRPVDSIHP
jgi:hypothetical protein